MEEKFSQFAAGGALRPGDTTVGLRNLVNTKFNQAFGADQIKTVVNNGSDNLGNGCAQFPWQTISYAISQITDASAEKPYLINAFGIFTDTDFVIKPHIYFDFNGGSYSVTSQVSLDASWVFGGNFLLANLQSLTLTNGLLFDFDIIGADTSFIKFSNINTTEGSTIQVVGSSSSPTSLTIDMLCGPSIQQNLSVSNCYGVISNSVINDLTIIQTDSTSEEVFSLENNTILGSSLIETNSPVSLSIFSTANAFYGSVKYSCLSGEDFLITSKADSYFSTLTIDYETVLFSADVLSITPIFTNDATSSQIEIQARNAVSAGSGLSYDNTTGIFTATGDQLVTCQDVYDNSNPAITTVVNGKPVVWDSLVEIIRAPSMTLAQAILLESPLNGGMGWLHDAGRPFWNVGTPDTPDIQQGAYLSDLSSLTPDASYGEMYFSGNTTATVIDTPGVPVQINATYEAGDLLNFTQSPDGTLTCTNSTTIEYRVSVCASGTLQSASGQIQLSIFHNGVIVPKSAITYSLDGISPSFRPLPIQAGISIAPGDTIKVYISNLTSTDSPTVDSLNCFISSIGGSNDLNDQVVILWDGSATPVSVVGSEFIGISGGAITFLGNATPDLEDAYTNGADATTTVIAGKPVVYESTEEGTRGTSMTVAQSNAINLPLNGLETWLNDANRKGVNAGTPSSPTWEQYAYLSDIPGVGTTLQSAYDAGDGTIVYSPMKPLVFQSDLTTTVPQTVFYQSDISDISNPIGVWNSISKNTLGNPINYGYGEVYILSPSAGSEKSHIKFHAMNNGVNRVYIDYNGITDTCTFPASNFLGSTSTSGNDSISGNSQVSGLSTVGVNSAGVNYTLGTTTTPTTVFPSNTYLSVWQILNGTNVVSANSFNIGDTIEIDITGILQATFPSPNADTGSRFRFQFGSFVNINSATILVGTAATFNRIFALKIKITRSATSTIICSAAGYYYDNGNVNKSISFFFNASDTYNAAVSSALTLEYLNGNSAGNTFAFVCKNLNIKQYS